MNPKIQTAQTLSQVLYNGKEFVKCFLKIKMDALYKTGTSTSLEIKEGSSTYQLDASFNKTESTVQLSLGVNTLHKISGTETENTESSYMYQFQILENNHLKIIRVLIAG